MKMSLSVLRIIASQVIFFFFSVLKNNFFLNIWVFYKNKSHYIIQMGIEF